MAEQRSMQQLGVRRDRPTPANPNIQQTFVPGVGLLGADLGGAVKGTMMRQQYELAQKKDIRDEEYLGIAKEELGIKGDYLNIAQADLGIRQADLAMRQEEFDWKRQDRARALEIDKGMGEALQFGGYTGVIDYLKEVDPERAIQFHANKLKLDRDIMTNDVMRDTVPLQKGKAMMESYSILGRMGLSILNAPDNQKDRMYESMKPILNQVLGDGAPGTLEEATPLFMLGAAQMVPVNQVAAAKQGIGVIDDEISRVTGAMKALELRGDVNSPAYDAYGKKLQQLQGVNRTEQLKAMTAELNLISSRQDVINKPLQATMKVQKELLSYSKDFIDKVDTFKVVKPLLDRIQVDPTDGMARGQLRQFMVKMTEGGRLTDEDIERFNSEAGYNSWSKSIKAYLTGQKVNLTDREVKQAAGILEAYMDEAYRDQQNREAQYRKLTGGEFSQLVDFEKISKPSELYENLIHEKPRAPQEAVAAVVQNPSLLDQFVAKYGYNPLEQ